MSNELNQIQNLIYEVRSQKVMLDRDLAELYGVEVKRLNEAVKRNKERFPADFMFQITQEEWDILRSQFAISNNDEEDSLRSQIVISNEENDILRSQNATAKKDLSKVRFLPFVFTEHGILMLSNVLNSTKAVSVSIQIVRVFNKLREFAIEQTLKDDRITELRKLLMLHIENSDNKFAKHDETIRHIAQILNNLIEKPPKTKQIGFTANR